MTLKVILMKQAVVQEVWNVFDPVLGPFFPKLGYKCAHNYKSRCLAISQSFLIQIVPKWK